MLSIFHTADIHLDAQFAFLGAKGQQQRQQVQDTFKTFIDRAIQERCALVLIAGDLFDSNSPSQKTVDFTLAQFSRLSAPVCILPGTHDCFNQRSIYRRVNFGQKCPNVHVFTNGEGERKEFPDLGLTVHARANLTNQSYTRPLQGLRPSPLSRWNVAMAHGSMVIPGVVDSPDFPIDPEEIAGCEMSYVALGHWHAMADYSRGKVAAFYPGCPEATSAEGAGAGHFLRVSLSDDGQALVKPEKIGRRKFGSLSFAMDGQDSLEAIKSHILAKKDPHLALTVYLTGLKEVGFALDPDELASELAGDFFHLRIVDRSHPKLADPSASLFNENTVSGRFVRIMEEKIACAASAEEAKLAEDALQLGVALLQGKEVLG